mmetsp:Transcript_19962/g.41729  ORF Transcript_19962/g.41729 Transcript_19962/m.41729 type:complete len:225 (-) Transcript_19962:29-703(-)
MTPAEAVQFCATSPTAAIVTLWPSGHTASNRVESWLKSSGATTLYTTEVPASSTLSPLLFTLALYLGEDWLESNCWYMEQPLPCGPPLGPYAGAKWKSALTFNGPRSLKVYVVDTNAKPDLWSAKYSFRAELARITKNPGNSCIHITDDQSSAVMNQALEKTDGFSCDASFAFVCSRVLLDPNSVELLNNEMWNDLGLESAAFRKKWGEYVNWLENGEGGFPVI